VYVYLQTEPQLWTVGHYEPDGKWIAESDHYTTESAAKRVHWLNGGYQEPRAPAQLPDIPSSLPEVPE
jgi:hypothetical protein